MKNLRDDLEVELRKFLANQDQLAHSDKLELLLKIYDLYLFKRDVGVELNKQDLYEIKNLAATKLKSSKVSLLEQDRVKCIIEAYTETLNNLGALNKTVTLNLE